MTPTNETLIGQPLLVFAEFFKALIGKVPYPWHVRFVEETLRDGFCSAIACGTGSGKSKVPILTIFCLAVQKAQINAGKRVSRTIPLRLFHIVDRRFVVDDVYDDSVDAAKKLQAATDGVLKLVADVLRSFEGDYPLAVSRMRGGSVDEDWALSVNQPTIVATTVNHFGSRLLCSGYGVSPRKRTLLAGLCGIDSLAIVDEADLSEPFCYNLNLIAKKIAQTTTPHGLIPLQVLPMSATLRNQERSFKLQEQDRSLLKAITERPKLVTLKQTSCFAKDATKLAMRFANKNDVIGIVCNDIKTVHATRELLDPVALKEYPDAIILTVIGRNRPFHKDLIRSRVLQAIQTARDRKLKCFIVSTQTIESGANLSLDRMVIQICPLSSLLQRIGRANRFGELPGTEIIVLVDGKKSPIYGEAVIHTIRWLQRVLDANQKKPIDLCSVNFEKLWAQYPPVNDQGVVDLNLVRTPTPLTPPVLDPYIDLLFQPSPGQPVPSDVSVFLRGFDTAQPEVQIIWRNDIADPDKLNPSEIEKEVQYIKAVAPVSAEILEANIKLARRIARLNRRSDRDNAEVFEIDPLEKESSTWDRQERKVYRWFNTDDDPVVDVISVADIAPGDTILIPSDRGGCTEEGLDLSAPVVEDIREAISDLPNQHPLLRLHLRSIDEMLPDGTSLLKDCLRRLNESPDKEVVQDLLKSIADKAYSAKTKRRADNLGKRFKWETDGHNWLVVFGPRNPNNSPELKPEDERTDRWVGEGVPLEYHSLEVSKRAETGAKSIGLPPWLVRVLINAGKFHDVAKAYRRFQVFLNGGRMPKVLLAKSGETSVERLKSYRKISGLPFGFRHELYSAAMVLASSLEERELTAFLIAGHHGEGPFFPPAYWRDSHHEKISYVLDGVEFLTYADAEIGGFGGCLPNSDQTWPELWWQQIREHGHWSAAFLVACLCLADRQQSRFEDSITS